MVSTLPAILVTVVPSQWPRFAFWFAVPLVEQPFWGEATKGSVQMKSWPLSTALPVQAAPALAAV
jgi:hypothetical protein